MAVAGQLKTKIDTLKKKISAAGASLPLKRRRQLRKRLKRLQRARRLALAQEQKARKPAKAAGEKESAAAAPPA